MGKVVDAKVVMVVRAAAGRRYSRYRWPYRFARRVAKRDGRGYRCLLCGARLATATALSNHLINRHTDEIERLLRDVPGA